VTTVYPARVTCTINGVVESLPWREFQVFMVLLGHAGRWVTTREIEAQIWGDQYCDPSNVAVRIHHLRKRIGPHLIESRRHRLGYRIR
jgi:DNA-binding response OmpR family regulator